MRNARGCREQPIHERVKLRRSQDRVHGALARRPCQQSERPEHRAVRWLSKTGAIWRECQLVSIRRLERLIVEGRVRQEGEGKRTVYGPAKSAEDDDSGAHAPKRSAQGIRLRALVRRPSGEREPAGYEIDWLRSYTAGKVWGTLAVYEHRRTELLRDFFLAAYAHSAAKYRFVKRSVAAPDPIRLRYRDLLREAVRDTVSSGAPPNSAHLRDRADRLPIASEDRARFEELVLELLLNLNEGSAARYGLRPNQFREWNARVRKPGH